jgi:hypothetical protein
MAAISPTTVSSDFVVIRTGTAQANTGQTDWVSVPRWAQTAVIQYEVTATAGTTPGPSRVSALLAAGGVGRDDSRTTTVATITGAITNTGLQTVVIGPGVSGIADALTTTEVVVNSVLPPLLGITITLDRTNADETYTYTLSAQFRG